ncbi:unnamed protein product, partial [Meganyctiphanes norvegica]
YIMCVHSRTVYLVLMTWMRIALVYVLLSLIVMCKGEGNCNEAISSQCPVPDAGVPLYFSDPSDCSKFCECSAGTAWSEHCAAGLLYDDIQHVCNWDYMVDCGSRPIINPE